MDCLGKFDREKQEKQKEELMRLQEDYTNVEKELERFYQEELQLVKSGEDPLMTSWRSWASWSQRPSQP